MPRHSEGREPAGEAEGGMSPRLPKYSRAGGRPKSTQRDSNDWSHVESKQAAPAKVHDVAERLREIPPDTRSLTGQLLGDPLPNDPRRRP